MLPVNFRSFRQRLYIYRKVFRRFLRKLEKYPPPDLDKLAVQTDAEVWQEVDCLTCANCCKKMTPTFTPKDIKRIAAHLQMTTADFKSSWLHQHKKDPDWVNVNQPCQFLDLATNKCSIYEVRPADCAGFPHLKKRKMVDYIHVHVQNLDYCPATFKMVEKMMMKVKFDKNLA